LFSLHRSGVPMIWPLVPCSALAQKFGAFSCGAEMQEAMGAQRHPKQTAPVRRDGPAFRARWASRAALAVRGYAWVIA
jgi:hypothetical protein